jgi:uncharacterized alpha-E superfamily protein
MTSDAMLSRVADNLYWMSRYLERAEHTARLLQVSLNMALDQSPRHAAEGWSRLLASLYVAKPEYDLDAYTVTEWLTFEPSNANSITNCIAAARENARHVREQISSEMWEQLNLLYLQVKRIETIWQEEPFAFLRLVRDGAHLFQGITDSTMNHGEGWQFIQAGRFIERAISIATLLDVHSDILDMVQREIDESKDLYVEWVGLLKSCTAFEAYCKIYTADPQPDKISEFLLLNAQFPHSVCFAIDSLQTALNAVADTTEKRKAVRANRLAGRLRATLSFDQIDEIMANSLSDYLGDIQQQCSQIHEAIHQTYIAYPIESALTN